MKRFFCFALASVMLLPAAVSLGFGGQFPQLSVEPVMQARTGVVMGRARVTGPDGGPILIKLRTVGSAGGETSSEEVEVLGEIHANSELAGVYILSGGEFRHYLKQYEHLRQARGALVQRAVFVDPKQLAAGLPTADGGQSTPVNVPDRIKSVLVLGQQDRFGPDPARWVLMEVPFLMGKNTELPGDVSSVLLNEDGTVRATAVGTTDDDGSFEVETFTYRVAYFGEGEEAVEQAEHFLRQPGDRVFGPIAHANLALLDQKVATDGEGRYRFTVNWPCSFLNIGGERVPITDVSEQDLYLRMTASAYTPEGTARLPLLMRKGTDFGCSEQVHNVRAPDFIIDLLWLNGRIRFANPGDQPIPVGEETRYSAESRQGDKTVQDNFDFDGDGLRDTAIRAGQKSGTVIN